MAVLALLIILLALIFGFGVVASGSSVPEDSARLNFLGFIDVSGTSGGLFLTGAVTMLALLSGIWLFQLAARRARQRRKEVKSLREAVVADRTSARSSSRTDPSYDDVVDDDPTVRDRRGRQ